VQRGRKAIKVFKVSPATQVQPERRAFRVFPAIPEPLAHKAFKVSPETQVQPVLLAPLGQLAHKVTRGFKVFKASKVFKARQAQLGQLAQALDSKQYSY
jgi:hypothetical protein